MHEIQSNVLWCLDLDGTTTDQNVKEAMEGEEGSSLEIQEYHLAAAEYLASQIDGLPVAEIYEGIKAKAVGVVLPNRVKLENWAYFPVKTTNDLVPISPAIDHFFVIRRAAILYLQERMEQEGESVLGKKIEAFLATQWTESLYQSANKRAMGKAVLTDEAVGVLEGCLKREDLVVFLSNSSSEKVAKVLDKAGLGERMVEGRVQRGSIGVEGGAMKWRVDRSFNLGGARFPAEMDLNRFYNQPGADITLDLRRADFYGRVERLMKDSGAMSAAILTDGVELDAVAFASWLKFRPRIGIKRNAITPPESIEVARMLGAQINESFAGLFEGMY